MEYLYTAVVQYSSVLYLYMVLLYHCTTISISIRLY